MADGIADTSNTEVKDTKQPPTPPPAGKTETPPKQEATPPKQEAKPDPKPEKKPDPKPEPRKHALGKADEEIPEDADLVEMTPRQLRSRLDRHTKAELKERFGTDSYDEIKKKIDRAEELEKAEEERKRAAMTEAEKLKADLEAEREAHKKTKERADTLYAQRDFDRVDSRMTRVAEKHIDPDYLEVELPKLAAWILENFDDKEAAKITDAQLDKYFKERLEAKPKLAKDYDEKVAKAAAKEDKKKVGANNSPKEENRPGEKRNGDTSPAEGKTFKPGQQNTMSKQEAKQKMREMFGGKSPY